MAPSTIPSSGSPSGGGPSEDGATEDGIPGGKPPGDEISGGRPPGDAGLARKPETGQRLEVAITGVGAQAMGIAHVEGFALLVPRGLPGERVEVEVGTAHARYAEASVTAVREASEDRVEAVCPDFESCGGCDWLHVRYERQLAFKRQVAEDQLRRIGKTEPPPGWAIVPSPEPLGYRDKLEFVTVRRGEDSLPGFHGFADGKPVPIAQCRLASPTFTELAARALELLGRDPYARRGLTSLVTRITVQGNDDRGRGRGLALTLHCNDAASAAAFQNTAAPFLEELGRTFPSVRAVALSVKPRTGKSGKARQILLKGPDVLFKTVGAERYAVPRAGFFQVNLSQAAAMVDRVRDWVVAEAENDPAAKTVTGGEAPLVLDLFCGAGLYAIPLAAAGLRVVGVELRQEVVRAAAKMAAKRGLEHAQFRAADLSRPGIVEGLVRKHGRPDWVILNPPRSGLPARLTETLLALAPPRLLYVSCDGATFARDVARLAPRYALESLQGFDMFPQTHHLELLGTFSLRPE